MKRLIFLLCLFSVNMAYSQEKNDSNSTKKYSFSVRLDIIRLFESSFAVHVERQIGEKTSIELVPFATYGTRGSGFVNNLYDSKPDMSYNVSYNNSTIMGGGIMASYKYYFSQRKNSISGTYTSFNVMFRRTSIYATRSVQYSYMQNGIYSYYYENEEVVHNLNVFLGGITFGYKKCVGSNFCFDIYAGGCLRLSKYDHQCITKYRDFGDFDYSGIIPTLGVSIGFCK